MVGDDVPDPVEQVVAGLVVRTGHRERVVGPLHPAAGRLQAGDHQSHGVGPVDVNHLGSELRRLREEVVGAARREAAPAAERPSRDTESPIETRDPDFEPIESTLPLEDPEFREIVHHFVDRLGEKLSEMDDAIEQGRWSELATHAHWLRGTSGTLGFEQFGTPTMAMEQVATSGDERAIRLVMQDIHRIADRILVPVG